MIEYASVLGGLWLAYLACLLVDFFAGYFCFLCLFIMSENSYPIALKLVGQVLCPFVQRAVIALKVCELDYEIQYVEFDSLPNWFIEISPLQQVPVLLAGGVPVFESLVILDYIDDVGRGGLHVEDDLERARQKSLIAFSSEMLGGHWRWSTTDKRDVYEREFKRLTGQMEFVETHIKSSGFFNGGRVGMIDVAFAPLLQNLYAVELSHRLGLFDRCPRLLAWAKTIVELDAVRTSMVEGADALMEAHLRERGSILAAL